MSDKAIYPLDDVHLDELLQHVIETQGSELILVTGKPPAICSPRWSGKAKEIRAYQDLSEPVLQRMIEDILTDGQIEQLKSAAQISDFHTTNGARYNYNISRDSAGLKAAFLLLPQL